MHLPDGFISGPINLAGYAISAGVCGLATVRARQKLGDRQVPLLGICAAFVFAAQMLNFPVAGGTSGHFCGAMFVAIMLGPLNACLVMALVLAIQCLMFADGGLTALGTNIVNMGIVASMGAYAVFALVRRLVPQTRGGFFFAVGAGSWFSVVLASAFCAGELALSGTAPLKVVLPAMVGVHAVIGVGEAMITLAVISVVEVSRPDLIGARPTFGKHITAEGQI